MGSNVIKMSVKGRYSHSMTLSEQAMFDAFDIFYLDDPALFEPVLRESVMSFAGTPIGEDRRYSDQDFRHLVDELSFHIKQMTDTQWDAYLNAFWIFYDKNPYGLSAAKDDVLAAFVHAAGNYLQSCDEVDREFSNQKVVNLLPECVEVINGLEIYWVKEKMLPYVEKDVIQLFRLTGILEELVFDELMERLDSDLVNKVFLS